MVVTCPSCHASYRHNGVAARAGRCSQCHGVFPLAGRRSYRIVEMSVSGRAAKIERASTALDSDSRGRPIRDGLTVEDSSNQARTDLRSAPDIDPPRAPDLLRVLPRTANPRDVGVWAAEGEEAPAHPGRKPLALVMMLGELIGVAAGYAFSHAMNVFSSTWMIVGGGAGLLAGWGWHRWVPRRP